ncbi:MAG: DUF4340 domain-containing protein [Clostridiales bacterium]|nr:DUF4340 domain-containing protein [Clostridiales bacterium]
MARKKRNAFTLVSLLLSLVVLVGIYIWYVNREKEQEAEDKETQEEITLSEFDKEKVKSLHYIANDVDITLVYEDELWISKEDPDRPINQDKVEGILNLIDEIKAKQVINEAPEDLEEYGLKEPKTFLEVVLEDDTTLSLKIGDDTVGVSGVYALVNEDGKVYLLASSYGSGLDYTDVELTAIEDGPSITASNIEYIQVIHREGEDFELIYDSANEQNKTGYGLSPWKMVKPYEEGYTADASKVSELQSDFSNFDFLACVDYSGEELESYGFDDPLATIKVGYYERETVPVKDQKDPETGEEITEKEIREDKQWAIIVGNQDEEGNYYVKREDSDFVYTMTASKIEPMLTIDAFEILETFVCIPNIENVNRIDIEIMGKIYTMEIERNEVTDEEGKEKTEATYYYMGNEVEEKLFKKVYQEMISAKYDAKIKEEVKADNITPYMTIKYYLNSNADKPLIASFLPYDDSFYLVDTGKKIRFFADKRQIEDIAEAVMEFKAE